MNSTLSTSNGNPSNPLLQAALRYASLGFAVFPCVPGTKWPATEHGFYDATTDPRLIELWWTKWPDANIGLATGTVVVVDADQDLGGPANPWPNDPDRALELAAAPMVRTPRGGRHYYFKVPPGKAWRCSQGRLAPRVDVKADGGYTLLPPSVALGRSYQFSPGSDLDVPPDKLPEPPEWLIVELDKLHQSTAVAAVAADGDIVPIREGVRNDTLFKLGCKLRHYGLTAQAIAAALQAENKQRCQPPLDEAEVAKIARSVSRYQSGPGEQPHPQQRPDVITLSDVEPQPINWLWPGYIPRGFITILAGYPATGKSLLSLDVAARVTTGSWWPEQLSQAPEGTVILVSAEDAADCVVRPRAEAAGARLDRIKFLRGTIVTSPDGKEHKLPFSLSDVDILRATLSQLPDPRLVILDPITSYLGGTDYFRDPEVREVLEPLAGLASEFAVAILCVAHFRKAGSHFAGDLVAGSRAFTALARSVLAVAADPKNPPRRLMVPIKGNLAAPQPALAFSIEGIVPRLQWESGSVWVQAEEIVCGVGRPSRSRDRESPALDRAKVWLTERLRNGPVAVSDLKSEARAAGTPSWRTIQRAAEVLGVASRRRGFGSDGHHEWELPMGSQVPMVSQIPTDLAIHGKTQQKTRDFSMVSQVPTNMANHGGELANHEADATTPAASQTGQSGQDSQTGATSVGEEVDGDFVVPLD